MGYDGGKHSPDSMIGNVYLYTLVEVIGREERPPQRDPIKKIKGGKHT